MEVKSSLAVKAIDEEVGVVIVSHVDPKFILLLMAAASERMKSSFWPSRERTKVGADAPIAPAAVCAVQEFPVFDEVYNLEFPDEKTAILSPTAESEIFFRVDAPETDFVLQEVPVLEVR